MIVINLDTPVRINGSTIDSIAIETPIRARHLLRAMSDPDGCRSLPQKFMERACSLPPGGLEELTMEDYAKVSTALIPFLASFQRAGLAFNEEAQQ